MPRPSKLIRRPVPRPVEPPAKLSVSRREELILRLLEPDHKWDLFDHERSPLLADLKPREREAVVAEAQRRDAKRWHARRVETMVHRLGFFPVNLWGELIDHPEVVERMTVKQKLQWYEYVSRLRSQLRFRQGAAPATIDQWDAALRPPWVTPEHWAHCKPAGVIQIPTLMEVRA